VREALSGPKDLTDRYIGMCRSIRDAAASRMADRPQDAVEIPSMVDLGEFDAGQRRYVRAEWGSTTPRPSSDGWVGSTARSGSRTCWRLLCGLDALVWVYEGEGMPYGRHH
jgi:hypothetical protein